MRLILLLLLTLAVQAQPYGTSNKATLRLASVKGGFKATLLNGHSRPLAVLGLHSGWCDHWNVKVRDRSGNEFGLVVPPGPAFMPEPGRFRVLKPKESVSATFKFSDFTRVNRKTDTLESLKDPAGVTVEYTFEPARDLDMATRMSPNQKGFGPEWNELFGKADFLSPVKASLKF